MKVPRELETGNAAIDAQHGGLLDEIERLRLVPLADGDPYEALDRSIDVLRDHFADHFAAEEALAEKAGYPDLMAHRREHMAFFDLFLMRAARWFATRSAEAGEAFVLSLIRWMAEHVMAEDIRLAHWIQSNPPQETPPCP